MGGCMCKRKSRHMKLTRIESDLLQSRYTIITQGRAEGCTKQDIENMWRNLIDPKLLSLVCEMYFKHKRTLNFTEFRTPCSRLLKGNNEEQVHQLCEIAIGGNRGKVCPSSQELLEYVCSILSTYICIHEKLDVEDYYNWKSKCQPVNDDEINKFATWLCADLITKNEITFQDINEWFKTTDDFVYFQTCVFEQLYGISTLTAKPDSELKFETIIPSCIDRHSELGMDKSVISVISVLFINSCIFNANKECWRLLYSNIVHGESFRLMIDRIKLQGPTVLVIKDNKGHIFGGYASECWKLDKHQFFGNSSCFLYKIHPEMKIYRSSGENNNYQYLAFQKKFTPNGLGMGGEVNRFGLWLKDSIVNGECNEFCQTYSQCPMLSGSRNFTVTNVEVWGFGPHEPYERMESFAKSSTSSVLLTETEEFDAASIFSLTGKTFHSESFPDLNRHFKVKFE